MAKAKKQDIQKLIEDNDTMYKVLESVSGIKCINPKRFRSTKYWLGLNPASCAAVLALDTRLCQDTLRILKKRL